MRRRLRFEMVYTVVSVIVGIIVFSSLMARPNVVPADPAIGNMLTLVASGVAGILWPVTIWFVF